MLRHPVPTNPARPESCLTADLLYLNFSSPDPRRLAEFYTRVMGYGFTEQDSMQVGRAPGRNILFSPGKAKTLAEAGYAVADAGQLERLRDRIRAAGVAHENGPTLMFADAVRVQDPDSNRFAFGLPKDPPVVAEETLTARMQHLVMASRNPEPIVRFFTDVLGFTLSDDVLDEEGGVRTSFVRSSHEHHSFAVFLAPEDRLDHHCYETDDWNMIRDWSDHMADQHVRLVWGPGRHGPGDNLFIFVHDPDGNWVEVSAELETVNHERPAGKWPHSERTLNSWGQGFMRS